MRPYTTCTDAAHAHLVEAHALLDLSAQAHRVSHGDASQIQPPAPRDPLVRLEAEVEPHQGRREEEEDERGEQGCEHAADAHLARGGVDGEVTASVGHVARLAEGAVRPLATAEVRHCLPYWRAGGGVRPVGAVVGAAADLGTATRAAIETWQDDGLQAGGGGAAGRAVGPNRARCAAGVAPLRRGEVGARLACALVGLSYLVVVRVARAVDGHASGAPGAGVAQGALGCTRQALAAAHGARGARRRRGASDGTPIEFCADRALGLVCLARVRARST
eukprot:scaffold9128_cov51-Phaeocystis_antarctica.AAC.2